MQLIIIIIQCYIINSNRITPLSNWLEGLMTEPRPGDRPQICAVKQRPGKRPEIGMSYLTLCSSERAIKGLHVKVLMQTKTTNVMIYI